MPLKAGFAEIDIALPIGTHKIGSLRDIVSDRVAGPLAARAAVFESAGRRIAFLQLDTLCVPAAQVADIRARIAASHGLPGKDVMVAATQNHAGPAVADFGDATRDDACVEAVTAGAVAALGQALAGLREAEVGLASRAEFSIAHNRRVVRRDGTVRTGGSFADPSALCIEGPIDPEVAVLGVRAAAGGQPLGAIANFACHPTHHADDRVLSAGFPGTLAAVMKSRGCPVTLFLAGACGNIGCDDPTGVSPAKSMEQVGEVLAAHVSAALETMAFTGRARLGCRTRSIQLPYRRLTQEQITGTARGAQRLVDPHIYDRAIPGLVARIRRDKAVRAEVQVLFIGEAAYVAVPAEWFAETGLLVKQHSPRHHALPVTCANGMVGHAPPKAAFARGGYETTLGPPSYLAEEAADYLADAAIALLAEGV